MGGLREWWREQQARKRQNQILVVPATDESGSLSYEQQLAADSHARRRKFEEAQDRLADLGVRVDVDQNDVVFRGEVVRRLANILADWFVEQGGNNYIEAVLTDGKLGPLIMRVERVAGMTPHALRIEAERERDRLAALLAEYEIEAPVSVYEVQRRDLLAAMDQQGVPSLVYEVAAASMPPSPEERDAHAVLLRTLLEYVPYLPVSQAEGVLRVFRLICPFCWTQLKPCSCGEKK